MATNLRLRPETESALREAAARSGRSQQDLIRDALDRYLGLETNARSMGDPVAESTLIPPRIPYRRPHRLLQLPEGVTSLDLLDREDRI